MDGTGPTTLSGSIPIDANQEGLAISMPELAALRKAGAVAE